MVSLPTKRLQNGFSMPVLGLGTWGMGGWMERDTRRDRDVIAAIQRAMQAGITHLDTAERYAEGHTEELVGEAIRGCDRSKLFLVSKVTPEHLAYDDLLQSAERSLKRLGTDYLDLYLIHNPNPALPIAETMRAMDHLVEQNLVRHIGVSNFSIGQLGSARRIARHPVVANQLHFNLSFREPEQEGLLRHAQTNDWMFIAFRPIRDVLLLQELPEILRTMCKKYAKTPAQVAINWLISQRNVVTLAKCGSREHLDDVLGAVGWSLAETDVELLRKEFPLPAHPPRPAAPAL